MNDGILIIGYGNTLRGDDGLGPYVVARIRSLPGVRTKAVLQLTPELAEELSRVRHAIFVDAGSEHEGVQVSLVDGRRGSEAFTHAAGVETILNMARSLFGHAPRAWIVSVAGSEFDLCEGLSGQARANARVASEAIDDLLRQMSCTSLA